MLKKQVPSLFKPVLAAACLCLSGQAGAAIVNGDFSAGMTGWVDATAAAGGSGSVQVFGGDAKLVSGSTTGFPAAVLVQGDDGNFTFSNPVTLGANDNFLVFDAIFERTRPAADESLTVFSDYLNVWVYDALDPAFDTGFAPNIDYSKNGALHTYALDISALNGRDVAISFELVDDNDGFDSFVIVDNVYLSATAPALVPLPASLWLFATGLLGLASWGRKRIA